MASSSRARIVFALKALALVAVLAVLATVLGRADWRLAADALRRVSPFGLVIMLLPFALGLLLEAAAWKSLLGGRGVEVPLPRLFHVKVATEALTIALPAGGLVAEALGPLLLAPPPTSAPIGLTLATATAKRWLTIRAHGAYVLLGALVGYGALRAHSRALVGHGALPWIVTGAGLMLVGVSLTVERAASRLGVAARLYESVERVRASRWFRRREHVPLDRTAFERVDEELAALAKRQHPFAGALLLVQWLFDALGSWVILRVLGVDVDFPSILACDAALSVVRALTVFAPSGLGVQDLGYIAFFDALGLPNAAGIAPAFLVLKRAKELFYVVVGFTLLLLAGRSSAKP